MINSRARIEYYTNDYVNLNTAWINAANNSCYLYVIRSINEVLMSCQTFAIVQLKGLILFDNWEMCTIFNVICSNMSSFKKKKTFQFECRFQKKNLRMCKPLRNYADLLLLVHHFTTYCLQHTFFYA